MRKWDATVTLADCAWGKRENVHMKGVVARTAADAKRRATMAAQVGRKRITLNTAVWRAA